MSSVFGDKVFEDGVTAARLPGLPSDGVRVCAEDVIECSKRY